MLEKISKEELMNLNNARILYYDFLNGFFVFELLDDRVEIFQKQLAILKNAPLSEEVEADFLLLENEISHNGIVNIKDEFSRLFALPFGEKQVAPCRNYRMKAIKGRAFMRHFKGRENQLLKAARSLRRFAKGFLLL